MSEDKKKDDTPTAPQVKEEIEKARGAEITVHPAASPLGTDAEAGSADMTREELKIARRQEARRGPEKKDD